MKIKLKLNYKVIYEIKYEITSQFPPAKCDKKHSRKSNISHPTQH